MSEIHDAKPGLYPCPTCYQLDKVVNVTVARDASAAAINVKTGEGASPAPSGEIILPTALKTSLSSAPDADGATCGMIALAFISAIPTVILYAIHANSPAGGDASFPLWPTYIPGAITALFIFGAIVSGAQGSPVKTGKDAAEAVSRLGWYCGRCGSVYFQPNTAPAGALDAHAYTTAEFRKIVFKAGGYENKA